MTTTSGKVARVYKVNRPELKKAIAQAKRLIVENEKLIIRLQARLEKAKEMVKAYETMERAEKITYTVLPPRKKERKKKR